MNKIFNINSQFKTEWIKYTKYEIKKHNKEYYISPKEGSDFTIFDPFEKCEELILSLIEIGDKAIDKSLAKESLYEMVIEFTNNYGLLGLITSSVYNRNILGESRVLLTDNNLINIKDSIMDEDEYVSLFTPFADEDDVYLRKLGKHITLFKAEDSPKFYGKRPLALDLVFSKFYCEKVEWVIEFAKLISTHLNQTLIYKNTSLAQSVTIMAGKFKAEKIGISIGMLDNPYIEWEFDSLKTAVEIIYAFSLTDNKNMIKRCEYCKKAFIAKSENEKYCTKSCRNCYNVAKSRSKKKDIDDKKK